MAIQPTSPFQESATMPVFSPEGKLANVPSANYDKALANGFRRAVSMVSPEGKQAYLPEEKVNDALALKFKHSMGGTGASWEPPPAKEPGGLLDTANEYYNAPAKPGEGLGRRLLRSGGRTAMMVPNLVQAAVGGPSEEEKAKGFAPPVLGDQGSLTNLPANAFDRVLSLPFKHLAVDPSRQSYQQIQGDVQQAEEAQGHPLSTPQQAVRGAEEGISMVPLLGPLLLSIARRIDPGNAPGAPPPDIAGGVADALTMHALPEIQREASPGGRLPGAPEAGELALPATRAALGKVAEKFPQAVQTVRGAISPEAMTAEQAATKAFRPRNSKANWQQEVASALPDVRRAADALKLDPNAMTLDDALAATSQAKKDVWGEYEHNFKQPNQDVAVDTTSVAGALRKTLSDRQIEQNPNFADRINEIADDYSGRKMSLQDVEDRVRELNNETRGIEAKYLTDKRAAKLDPQNAPLFAERDTLRQLMLDKMDELSGPGAAQLRKRWGALNSLEDVVSRRIPVAQRQVPNSLPSVLAKAYAAGKVARGVFTLNPADILEGGVSLLSQRKSALLNDPDYLTQLAFRKTVPRSPFVPRFQGDYQAPAGAAPSVPPVVPKQLYGMQLEHMQPVDGEYVQPPAPPIRGLLNRGQYNQPPKGAEDFEFNQPQLPAKASAIPLRASTAIEEQPRANVPVPVELNEPQRPVVQGAGTGNDEQLPSGISGRVQGSDQPQRAAQSAQPGPGTAEYEALKNRIAVLERARRGSRVQPPPTPQVEAQPQSEPQAQPIAKPQTAAQPQATAQTSTPDVVEGNREQILQSELKDLKTKREQAMQQLREAPTYGPEATRLRERHNELLRQIQQRDDELARLKGEPTRSEKRAMQEQQAEKAFADRPEQAMKYGQPEQSQHWQVKEPDYIEKRFQQKIADYERAIPQQQVEVAKTSSTSQKGIQAKANLKYWEDLLEAYKNRDPRKAQQFKTEYNELVKKAVSQGRPVPQEVIDQKSEFELAQDARERYEKGRHTSFANKSAAINDTMQKEEGFKVKRQDGKPITDQQIKEISSGVDDVTHVLGEPLRDALRGTDVTVAHTNGKHPFLSDAGGLYHPMDKTISMGINDFLGRPVKAFAHELGHWFDYESGRAMGVKNRIYTKGGKSHVVQYASESRDVPTEMYDLARRSMTDTREVSRMLKISKLSDLPDAEHAEVERVKVLLGPYWKEPRELFARMFEQHVADKLGKSSTAAEDIDRYYKAPAWWSKEAWAKLKPMFEKELEKRMSALRDKYAPAENSAPLEPQTKTKADAEAEIQKSRTPIASFENKENGVVGHVTPGAGGKFHASLHDLDTGEQVGPVSIYPEQERATARAQELAGVKSPEPEKPSGIYGSQTQVLTSGQNLPGKYRVVEADQLIPSHDAGTFAPNPKYPHGVQERTYHTSKEAQARVIQQAQNYDPNYTINTNPDAVNGPPVVTKDGIVLGGNSRTMSTQRLYSAGRGDAYKNELVRQAGTFGLDSQQIAKMNRPVLVREVTPTGGAEGMRRLGADLNKSMTGALGVQEKAVSAGRSIKPETLDSIGKMRDDLGEGATLRDVLREHGKEVLGMLTRDGAVTDRERPQLIDTGTGGLSEEGKTFVERALLGSVVDDPVLMEKAPKNILDKVGSSLGELSSLSARDDHWNIVPLIREALADHAEMASTGNNMATYLNQPRMFGAQRSPAVEAVVRNLGGKPKAVKQALRDFADAARMNQPGQATLGLMRVPTASEAFNEAFGSDVTEDQLIDAIRDSMAKETPHDVQRFKK